jgi:hypothetical protein
MPLPDGAVAAVMRKFGKPLAEDVDERAVVEQLELGDGTSLTRFRFLPRYDVIARDYIAWNNPPETTLCELATSVAAALTHLAYAAREKSTAADE